jgi:predicted nucleotidyltransferase
MIIDSNLAVSTVTKDVIDYVVDKIVQTVHPAKIILFGSQARRDNRATSDIDLLVVTQPGEDREKIRLEIEHLLRGRRFGIDLLVRTPKDVQWNIDAENPFYQDEILREGRVMYEC